MDANAGTVDIFSDSKLIRWTCHLHKSSQCKIARNNDRIYHIVSVKRVTPFAQLNFNVRKENLNEFWEDFGSCMYMAPIALCDSYKNKETFLAMCKLFNYLDENKLKFTRDNDINDILTKHIVTDGDGRVALCNSHLLKYTPVAAQCIYTRTVFIRNVIKALFGIQSVKNIPISTPEWLIHFIDSLKNYDIRPERKRPTPSISKQNYESQRQRNV